MLVGFGVASSYPLLEVGYIVADDGTPVIIHAMPARDKYLR